MNDLQENDLRTAGSAYLRSALHQPVAWMEWGPAAFARARQENKPVLLDIGAVWCHWCHVMDRESYEDAETAALINEHYVAVKVDRDERPDVDSRYQTAVASISGQGGWPLTAFLTPEGMPYFGGTYFPAEERYGRPSFRRVLLTMADAFQHRRAEVEESAASVLNAIEQSETFTAPGVTLDAAAGPALLGKLVDAAVQQFDPQHGGFGSQPKFPHAGALTLLMATAARTGSGSGPARDMVEFTLRRMADGGIYDHIGGGFHRYSVDERWHVPHFEKMAYDNSELLKVYVYAFQSFGDDHFAAVANDIVRWMDEVLSDRLRGGFYGSQDADATLNDDGDYFTWTEDEMHRVLAEEEFAAARMYFGMRPVGDMHHNPAKNVLRRRLNPAEIAAALGVAEARAEAWLTAAKEKLAVSRAQRPAPLVDTTLYAGWNGMCISAYLAAAKVLKNGGEVKSFAIRSLERVLAEAWQEGSGQLTHVVAYAETLSQASRVPGVLEDYAFVATAALDAWEITGELRYATTAQAIAEAMLTRFWDETDGGFFDTQAEGVEQPLGALRARRKPVQDAPTPAGNPVAASLLLRLASLTGESRYEARARETLQAFAGVVEHLGLYAASYGLALGRLLHEPMQITVLGEDGLAQQLAAAAETPFTGTRSVVRLRWSQLRELPPALAETLPHLAAAQGSVAVVCRGVTCLAPVRSVEALRASLLS